MTNFEDFYREAEARDNAMSMNLLKTMEEKKVSVAVLITGGFHSSGIDAQLNDKGFTSVAFVPKITKVDDLNGSAYLSVFTQEKTPLDKLFAGEKLFVNPNPAEVGLAEPMVRGYANARTTNKSITE